jgi:DNA-binding cell septation regulator SpoVG
MNITIENHGDQFNVALTSPGKDEPFLTIKGCRVVNGSKGPFVSWPSRKQDNGKWWNHVYASDGFAAAVLSAYNKSKAEAPRRAPAAPHDDSDIPF